MLLQPERAPRSRRTCLWSRSSQGRSLRPLSPRGSETPAVRPIQVHDHEVGSCLSEELDSRRVIWERTEHLEARASAEGDQEILSEPRALGDHEDPDGVHNSARNIGISEAEDELFREGWDTRLMNRLAGETSPYLLQHAGNPVDWSPWDQEALRRARIEERPIFLSIGYAACHWCHVMERESFEDEETAAFLNGTSSRSRSTGRSGPTSTRSTWMPSRR